MINRFVVVLTLAALMIALAMRIRSVAQSANPASNTKATNVMARYFDAVQQTIVSGTLATNLTEAEVSRLMNESIKTNLAAQLWFRKTMQVGLSAQGARMAGELRVLEILREGRTTDAIRELEDRLDADIISLAGQLRAVDEIKGNCSGQPRMHANARELNPRQRPPLWPNSRSFAFIRGKPAE